MSASCFLETTVEATWQAMAVNLAGVASQGTQQSLISRESSSLWPQFGVCGNVAITEAVTPAQVEEKRPHMGCEASTQ